MTEGPVLPARCRKEQLEPWMASVKEIDRRKVIMYIENKYCE